MVLLRDLFSVMSHTTESVSSASGPEGVGCLVKLYISKNFKKTRYPL